MLASSFSTRFLLRKNRRSRSLPPLGATCSLPHFRFAQMWPRARTPALLVFNSVFAAQKPAQPVVAPTGGNVLAPPFSLCSNVAPRSHPGPPRFQLGFCCAKIGAAGYRPHLLGLPRKSGRGISLRETTLCGCPLRGHGFATPHRCFAVPVTAPPRRAPNGKTPALAPIRSHFAPRNRAAGRCPRRGQRARYPIFAPLKCGPAYSRGVCRGTFLCSTAGPALAPRRLLPFGRISLRETARPVIGPTGADVLACLAFALLKRGPPAKTPALLVFNSVFAARKPAGASPRFRTAGR